MRLMQRFSAFLLALLLVCGSAFGQLATVGAGKGVVGAGGGGGFTPSPIALSDNFNDSSKNTSNWNATTALPPWQANAIGGSVSETTTVSITPTTSVDTVEGYSSVNTYDFSAGRTVYVHLVTAPNNNETTFGVWIGAGEWLRFSIDKQFGANTITAHKQNFGNSETLWGAAGSVTYDSTNHAWLAIHYNGTNFLVYTAPNSGGSPGSWTLRGTSATSNFVVTALRTGFFTSASNASPGTAVYDGFNTSD